MMKIEYETNVEGSSVSDETHHVVDKHWCCQDMERHLDVNQHSLRFYPVRKVGFDADPDVYLIPQMPSQMKYDDLRPEAEKVSYCPFCGDEIVTEEVRRFREKVVKEEVE